ncbi:MAG: M6 family metalloprotease domain-containing protein [Candidatus Cloacimonetes bacterium]|nr:M6 family metalloprotease domain-containing protein [Candidatus Cloacimonadota bacterium]
MKLYIYTFCLAMCLLLPLTLPAAWLNNVEYQVMQRDGTEIDLLTTGDEYYHWVHDEKDFTIVLDDKSGDWCWAVGTSDGGITSSGYPIHLVSPESVGIEPKINISEQKYAEKREYRQSVLNDSPSRTPSLGVVQNIVIFIRFSDQSEFTHTVSYYDTMCNAAGAGVDSQYQYYWDASYEQFEVFSNFYPIAPGTTVISYQSTHPRGYCSPYHPNNNPGGYTTENQGFERLHEILGAAIVFIANEVPASLVIDADGDNRIDNICFILRGHTDGWSDVLWPHRWVLINTTQFINGKRAWDYNLNIENDLLSSGNGTLAHEFGHSMGMPDLYRYNNNYNPVGNWDLMASAVSPPVGLGAYMKARYTQWGPDLEVISEPGTYTLFPVTESNVQHAYRINSPYSTTEYFVVEYRKRVTGHIDGNIYGSGLLVYRINPTVSNGNMDGPPDEVYIYRPGGNTYSNGTIANAHFSSTVGRTQINDNTNPSSFLSNGQPGGLSIANIGVAGETISFDIVEVTYDPPSNLTGQHNGATVNLSWTAPGTLGGLLGYKVYRDNHLLSPEPVISTSFADQFFYPGQAYTYSVSALYIEEESSRISTDVATGSYSTITSFPWTENFTGAAFAPAGWGILDLDGDADSLFKYTQGSQAYSGDSFAASASRAGNIYHPDNWLITPQIAVQPNMQLSYYIGSTSTSNYFEHISVLISTSNAKHGSFRHVRSEVLSTPQWRLKAIDLTPYVGQNIFVAFRHHDVSGQAVLKLDAVRVGAPLENGENDVTEPYTATQLIRNYPNPFNPDTSIKFYLDTPSDVGIDIYNVKGQKIKQLASEPFGAGVHEIVWNGTDENGANVGTGIYFYQMRAGDFHSRQKMLLLK